MKMTRTNFFDHHDHDHDVDDSDHNEAYLDSSMTEES